MSIFDAIVEIGVLVAIVIVLLPKLGWWDKCVEAVRSFYESSDSARSAVVA
jgi:hypothetical protein